MNAETKKTINIAVKIAFILCIINILVQGALKLIFNINTFDMTINKNIAEFFLFKNIIVQAVILQLGLMTNYVLAIGIANKAKLKDVVKKTWPLLLLTYPANFLPKSISFFVTVIIGIIINIAYLKLAKRKQIIYSSFKIIIVAVAVLAYQYVTIFIRLNHIPMPYETFGFYQQLVYMMEMYFIMYLYYKHQIIKGVQ